MISENDLSPGQVTAMDAMMAAILRERESDVPEPLVLVGPAGSGKTTLLKVLIARLRAMGISVAIIAPTGRAAQRASEVAGIKARTLHSASFGGVMEADDGTPVFTDAKAACAQGDVLICDEASMVDERMDRVLRENLPRGSVLVYVGDKEQLPPVAGRWGPDFEAPTAELTEIHRQAQDNPIVTISMQLRQGVPLPKGVIGDVYERGPVNGLDAVAQWMAERVTHNKDAFLLCWTNDTRSRINRLVRAYLGHKDPVCLGERLMVLANNHQSGLCNGHIVTVERIKPLRMSQVAMRMHHLRKTIGEWELENLMAVDVQHPATKQRIEVLICPSLMGLPQQEVRATLASQLEAIGERSVVRVDYGYGCTVHKAQGCQAEEVGFVIDRSSWFMAKRDPVNARRLIYTAITRSSRSVRVFDVE